MKKSNSSFHNQKRKNTIRLTNGQKGKKEAIKSMSKLNDTFKKLTVMTYFLTSMGMLPSVIINAHCNSTVRKCFKNSLKSLTGAYVVLFHLFTAVPCQIDSTKIRITSTLNSRFILVLFALKISYLQNGNT